MSDELRQRWQRMMIAGARELNQERWDALVGDAVALARDYTTSSTSDGLQRPRRSTRHVTLTERQMVVSAADILDVERALIEALRTASDALELLGHALVDARRMQLSDAIEKATASVEHALKQRGES